MKKILTIVFILLSLRSSSQVGLSAGIGLNVSPELSLTLTTKRKQPINIIFGAGGILAFKRPSGLNKTGYLVGTSYINGDGKFGTVALFVTVGVSISKFEILARVGAGEFKEYNTGDNHSVSIAQPGGDFYVIGKKDIKPVLGGTVGYRITNHLSVYAGYTNISSALVGIKLNR